MRYRLFGQEITEEEYENLKKEAQEKEFNYSLILGSSVEQYVKEGSLNKLKAGEKSKEIFIKLPNWGDIRLSTYTHDIYVERLVSKIIEESGEEFWYWEREYLFYYWPMANLKIKVVPGDNSGYAKYYFVSLCFCPHRDNANIITKGDLEEMIVGLLNNNTVDDKFHHIPPPFTLYYFDSMTGGGI